MRLIPTKTLPFIFFALAALAMAGCAAPAVMNAVVVGGDVGGMYLTSPNEPPPADTADQIAQHESWCYETLGYAECYSCPQDVPPNRLINVDPANRYPLNVHAYNEAVLASQPPVMAKQSMPVDPTVNTVTLSGPAPLTTAAPATATTAPQTPVKPKPKHKKHKKPKPKPSATTQTATPPAAVPSP